MVYNADRISSDQDTVNEAVDGTLLRHRYLSLLMGLERRSRAERRIKGTVLSSKNHLGMKRRRISVNDNEEDSNKEEGEANKVSPNWPSPEWREERDKLFNICVTHEYGKDEAERWARADELLRMIEAVGCSEIMAAWTKAKAQYKNNTTPGKKAAESTAKVIYRLAERTGVRSFNDKIILRIGKWLFALKISEDVNKSRGEKEVSGGNAVTNALEKFLSEVHPDLTDPNQKKQEYRKYKKWWDEGKIWVALCDATGAGILLLIPGSHCVEDGHTISNKQ